MHFNAFWMHYNAFQRPPMICNALKQNCLQVMGNVLTFFFPTFFNALATFPNILIPKVMPLWLRTGYYKTSTHSYIENIHRVLKPLQTTSQISCHSMLLFSAMINTENKVLILGRFFLNSRRAVKLNRYFFSWNLVKSASFNHIWRSRRTGLRFRGLYCPFYILA